MSGKIIFGHMHEDHALELSLAFKGMRALVIASGGDLALGLAAHGVNVIAVDSNPAQIELVAAKMEMARNADAERVARWLLSSATTAHFGERSRFRRVPQGLCFCGVVDQIFSVVGPVLRWIFDWPRVERQRYRNPLFRLLREFVRTGVATVHGQAARRALTSDALDLMVSRLVTATLDSKSATNPYLQVLFGRKFGQFPPFPYSEEGISGWKKYSDLVDLRVGTVQSVLSELQGKTLELISVSNLVDVVDERGWRELCVAAARVLKPGGTLIARSMLFDKVPETYFNLLETANLVFRDESPLCPIVWVARRQ